MTQDTLAKISTYFRGIDEELLDNDALLRILDVISPLWNDVPIRTAGRSLRWPWLLACFATTNIVAARRCRWRPPW